jgi:hypothetical protein
MRLDNGSNYNVLGKMGPIYQRPEYRPPQKNPVETGGDGQVGKGDKKETRKDALTLSTKTKVKAVQKTEVQGKLNLQGVKDLTELTATDIASLSPKSVDGCPHKVIGGDALMYPTYA